ncbi:uncharacterized protein LOC143116214 [Alosa pseudoharengus]|uniref:uncharacterized protein LOC143116214 n=1 Tax=Alosa pseudoharengus TaxID=34774 RepID=UPI003F8AFB50
MSNTQPHSADQSNTQPSLDDPQPNSRIDQDMHRLGNSQQTPVPLLESAAISNIQPPTADEGNQVLHGFGNAQFTPEIIHPPSIPDVPDTLDGQTTDEPITLTIRRGHCLSDLIQAFKNPDILNMDVSIKMRLPNGALEEGEGSGVTRDCLTEFWTDFYERCTLGGDVKVPFIRHDYQFEEWQAVARILVVGWKFARYFPVKLAPPFLEMALYGTNTSSLKDSFLQYVSDNERQVLLKALEDFNSVEKDDLFDALEIHDCLQMPNEENLIPLLSQLGHKALLQAPLFIIESWRPILQHFATSMPPDVLHGVLCQKIPTAKAVKELLMFPHNMSPLQTTVARYLKRYIGDMDMHNLQLFLRFCTGSNLIGKKITVEFIETSEFQRRPQSHTCGCILKLPVGYHNYPELRCDFNNILASSVWVMDYI